jgi:hypothetical protein
VGFNPSGGHAIINPGNKLQSVRVSQAFTSTLASAGNGHIDVPLPAAALFPPSSTAEYIIILNPGEYTEEWLSVNSIVGTTIFINSLLKHNHAIGTPVIFIAGNTETVEYVSINGNSIVFNNPIVFSSNHMKQEDVRYSRVSSETDIYRFGFPLVMPVDLAERIRVILDLLRAAGVQVTYIENL